MIDWLITLLLRLRGFKSARVRVQGAEVHYLHQAGEPGFPTVVLVHGIGARATHFAEVMIELARSGYPVIVPDLPGHGDSSELDGEANPETLFDTVRRALEEIAPGRFVLFGNSLGGGLSLRYASEQPKRVSALILASPAAGFELESEWQEMRTLLRGVLDGKALHFLDRVFHRKPFYLPLLAKPFRRAISRRTVRELVENTSIADFQLREGLEIYSGRTLLIWGRCEALFPRILFERLRERLPAGVEVEEPEEIGHCPHLDDPRWFIRRVREFIGSGAGASRAPAG